MAAVEAHGPIVREQSPVVKLAALLAHADMGLVVESVHGSPELLRRRDPWLVSHRASLRGVGFRDGPPFADQQATTDFVRLGLSHEPRERPAVDPRNLGRHCRRFS